VNHLAALFIARILPRSDRPGEPRDPRKKAPKREKRRETERRGEREREGHQAGYTYYIYVQRMGTKGRVVWEGGQDPLG